ncbi:uncharacterized protein K02A2.6-like [Photinus pyralis]|uniref:uncharacterized protein K02A2.6-like n=1 Tax=Photinus pyralis TaxID=7054 RepID=UPI0012671E67|nr:uncharacterized protein K02A2.6-like [Photinus pyralis]
MASCSLQPMNLRAPDLSQAWKTWKTQFLIYLRATGLDKESDARKVALMLHYLGPDCLKIYNSFNENLDSVKYDELETRFDAHFTPTANISFERHIFITRKQGSNESLEDYVTALTNLSLSCDLGALRESLIKDIFTCGLNESNHYIKEKLIGAGPIELNKAVELAKTASLTKAQMSQLSSAASFVGAINNQFQRRKRVNQSHTKRRKSVSPSTSPKNNYGSPSSYDSACTRCGQHHRYRCPAATQICNYCHRRGHFVQCCFKKKSRTVHQLSTTEDLFLGMVECENVPSSDVKSLSWESAVHINNKEVICQLDTGAQTNIISLSKFTTLGLPNSNITPCSSRVSTFTGHNIDVIGSVNLTCKVGLRKSHELFHVANFNCVTILGLRACINLKLVKRLHNVQFDSESNQTSEVQSEKHNVLETYKDVFEGLGKIDMKCHFVVDKNIKPVIEPLRKIPFMLHKDLEKELKRMVDLGVIIRISEPTAWVNSIVITTKKNGNLRICLDPRNLNKAIKRSHYPFPNIDSVTSKLANACFFSTLDANSGFWTIPLDDQSSKLCTFITPFGRFRFLRLPFGINSAPEIFHATMVDLFAQIKNVIIYFDDLLIFGSTKKEHDSVLKTVLDRARSVNMRFNPNKSHLCKTSVTYMGHVFSSRGIHPDPLKIKAIVKMPEPKNKQDLQRFMGMLTYLSSFIINFSDHTKVLRLLIKKDNPWHWDEIHRTEFNKLKTLITKAPVLTYFDTNKKLTLSCDSSQYAVGAVISHDINPIAFASASLTDCQQNYAQIERELLAIVYGCIKFHQYIYGQKVLVHTDHKPLIPLFIKPLYKVPQRLQRFMLKIQAYDLEVQYVPGNKMFVSDTLSRAPLSDKLLEISDEFDKDLNLHVNLLVCNLAVSSEQLNKIREQTNNDQTLLTLSKYYQDGWPSNRNNIPLEVRPFLKFSEFIHVADGIVFKGDCIVIPSSLRKEMLAIIHEGHFGIDRCIKFAKNSLFWPNMSSDIKNIVSTCITCQQFSRNNSQLPLMPHEIKLVPWYKIGVDFMDVLDKKYLVCIDYFSKYIEIAVMQRGCTALLVIIELKSIFARHGIPVTLISDNGPPFGSNEFANFVKTWHINHVTASPHHAQSNGQVERSIGTLKNMIIKAFECNEDPYLALLQYRTTPNESLNSPSQLLMSRLLRTRLPIKESLLQSQLTDLNKQKQFIERMNFKKSHYFNKSCKTLNDLVVGQKVLFKKALADKKWHIGTIVSVGPLPRTYQVQNAEGTLYRRNRMFFKPLKTMETEIADVNNDNEGLLTNSNSDNSLLIVPNPIRSETVNDSEIQVNDSERHTRSGRLIKTPSRLNL